jgi:hypothetical protein
MAHTMEYVYKAAMLSVARACAFAALAIACVMMGLVFDTHQMFRAGMMLTHLLVVGLVIMGWYAPHQDHRDTETWLLLSSETRPSPKAAQRVIGLALRDTYFLFASYAAAVAALFAFLSVVTGFVGL